MANWADTAAARVLAENLVKTRMAAKTWVVGFMCVDKDGHTAVHFIRPMTSALTQGAWVESRADDAT
jgi:hypothetical protein